MAARRPFFAIASALACSLTVLTNSSLPAAAADLAFYRPIEPYGVVCTIGVPFAPPLPTAETLPWARVWYGHFSGGRPVADPYLYGRTLIDWQDDNVCFPSKRSCDHWIAHMRRWYHHPEGYWTCLPLR